DAVAGVIVGIVALPLAIAFAIASGVTPERGLFTAIVAGFLISALGGSRVQIGGPTGAFVVIVYAIVQRHGVEGLAAATMMAGVMLVIFGVVRLGGAIKFIPYPVTIGFTSGIALVIFSSQVKDFLGLRMGAVPADFVGKWQAIGAHLDTIDPWALLVGLTALAIIVGWPLVNRRVPSPFVALIATTAMVQLLHFPVETIGSRFGAINAALPAPALPAVTPPQLPGLLAPAFTIALLGAIESLLSAVVADGMIGGRHRSNMELVAHLQGRVSGTQERRPGAAHHLPVDGARGPHRRDRGGDGARRLLVHAAHGGGREHQRAHARVPRSDGRLRERSQRRAAPRGPARRRGLRDHGSVLLRRGGDAAGPPRRHRRPSQSAHHPTA